MGAKLLVVACITAAVAIVSGCGDTEPTPTYVPQTGTHSGTYGNMDHGYGTLDGGISDRFDPAPVGGAYSP
jgi:hypothetical protein